MRLKLLAVCGALLLTGCIAVPYHDGYGYGDGYGGYYGAPYVSGTFVYQDDRHYRSRSHNHRRHHDNDRYYHDNHRRRGRAWDRDG